MHIFPQKQFDEATIHRNRYLIAMTVTKAAMMELLDTSIVNVAIPQIMGNLGATLEEVTWVSTGYIVANVIVLPLSGPGLVASALFVITFAWNDFVVAVVMLSSEEVKTLPVAIYGYLGFYGREWGPLTASAMLSILPVIVVFVFFQRYFLGGMTSGGVKS